MKDQLVEKNNTEQTERTNDPGINIDKSTLLFGGLYALTMMLILLVIYEGF